MAAAFDTLKAKIQEVADATTASKTAILAAVADEKTQVADAIAALEAKMGDVLSPNQMTELTSELDALKGASTGTDVTDAVQGIFVPPVPTTPTP